MRKLLSESQILRLFVFGFAFHNVCFSFKVVQRLTLDLRTWKLTCVRTLVKSRTYASIHPVPRLSATLPIELNIRIVHIRTRYFCLLIYICSKIGLAEILQCGGSGATRPLPRDRRAKEFRRAQ